MSQNPYVRHNEQKKANFDGVYDLPDPRGYFRALGALDYRAPEHGYRVFSALLETMQNGGAAPKVLDLCCSYGVNAALIKHELTLNDLYARYGSEDLAGLSAEELVAADREFYAGRRRTRSPEVVGTDVAGNAVSYALRAGLLDAGTGENLEQEGPTQDLARAARGAGLVTVTGGVGYIWERTFERVLSFVMDGSAGNGHAGGDAPWVAAFAVRFVDYSPVAAVLARRGLVTEKLSLRTFPQRRFEGPPSASTSSASSPPPASTLPARRTRAGTTPTSTSPGRPGTLRTLRWTRCWAIPGRWTTSRPSSRALPEGRWMLYRRPTPRSRKRMK